MSSPILWDITSIMASTTAFRSLRSHRSHSRWQLGGEFVSFRRLWIGPFVLVVVTIHSHSVAVKNLHIDDLVRASDVIAIAEVANVREIGHAPPVLFDDQLLEADSYSADLQVKKIIKGSAEDRVLVKYALPLPFVGYRGFQRGTRLVFLRREQDHYGVADPYYPDFPAVPSLSGNELPHFLGLLHYDRRARMVRGTPGLVPGIQKNINCTYRRCVAAKRGSSGRVQRGCSQCSGAEPQAEADG